MTWSTSSKLQAGETFDPQSVKGQVPEQYQEDLEAVAALVPALDTWDPKRERTVYLSGYRSDNTNSIQVGVSGHKDQSVPDKVQIHE